MDRGRVQFSLTDLTLAHRQIDRITIYSCDWRSRGCCHIETRENSGGLLGSQILLIFQNLALVPACQLGERLPSAVLHVDDVLELGD